MKLAIISHTEHYENSEGTIVGWGATVSEINNLLEIFDEVYHIAMFHDKQAPKSALAYKSNRIHFIPIHAVGGKTIKQKFDILLKAPTVIATVSKTLKKVDCFQLRTPTGIGMFLIPYLTILSKKRGWYKYAGNWNQEQPPLGYRLQRWMLKHQNRKVTINGMWPNQPKHHLSFENPCLTEYDIVLGKQIRNKKVLGKQISFCYVGRLETQKGVELIIRAFTSLKNKKRIGTVHLVGDGEELQYFKDLASNSNVDFLFHGSLARNEVFEIYKQSHVFLMPTTASEGFPKVIAEAMNFGCIPLVSNISAIGHYIENEKNGVLLHPITLENLIEHLKKILNLEETKHNKLLNAFDSVVGKFTFSHYNSRIKSDILNI